jgi:outer membrane protein OmpA-like peptidoglycan-associated protein
MRIRSTSAAAILALAFCCCLAGRETLAQVQVDPRALDQLQPKAKPTPRPTPRAASKPSAPAYADGPHQTLPPIGRAPAGPAVAKPGATAPLPPTPPPAPVLPPPIAVPVRPLPPPPPAPVADDAPGAYSKLPGGLRVTFGGDRADLNPETLGALRILTHSAASRPDTTYNVTAYAAGAPDDPSSARRLALSRALAVRSVLMGEGIPSVRIYVKALGATSPTVPGAPLDRADVTMESGTPGAASPPPTTGPTTNGPAPNGPPPDPAAANQKAAP